VKGSRFVPNQLTPGSVCRIFFSVATFPEPVVLLVAGRPHLSGCFLGSGAVRPVGSSVGKFRPAHVSPMAAVASSNRV
jgi:hypothetical protein